IIWTVIPVLFFAAMGSYLKWYIYTSLLALCILVARMCGFIAARCTGRKIIISSNVKSDNESDTIVNYHSLINRQYTYFENSTMMLLTLLKRLNPSHVIMAGFDGFSENAKDNYSDSSFQNDRHIREFETLNKEIGAMFHEIVEKMSPKCDFKFLTPSLFEWCIR
ncbi:MAG: hypothetical protein IKO56_10615, partial [Alphaproteobacteria bacterium]|nr:hypothetical protein [Alphaproteobacteria bacterium]